MFEPAETDADVLKIAVSLPRREAVSNGDFIPLEKLEVSLSEDARFDAVFVSGLSPEQSQSLAQRCADLDVDLIVFESPSNHVTAIEDVVINMTDKLFSDEMPDNIDLIDIRYINQCSDSLFAFNNKASALYFLEEQDLGSVIGGVYLAHGNTELTEFETTNNELLNRFSDSGFLCSSFHYFGRSECSILLGIKRSG